MKMYNKALEIKAKMDANQKIADDVEAAGGIHTERMQSDKVGQDWIKYYVNNIHVRSVYIQQENPIGTSDNPFEWGNNVPCVPNAFYTHDNVRKVWMGNYRQNGADWNDNNFAEF